MTPELPSSALAQVLTAFGLNTHRLSNGTLMVGNGKSTLAIFLGGEASERIPVESMRNAQLVICCGSGTARDALNCPRMAWRAKAVAISELVICILSEMFGDGPEVRSEVDPSDCQIECVFSRQVEVALSVLAHNRFGFLMTFGAGERLLHGNAGKADLQLLASWANDDKRFLESRAVDCLFLQQRNIPFTQALSMLRDFCDQSSEWLESSDALVKGKCFLEELKRLIDTKNS